MSQHHSAIDNSGEYRRNTRMAWLCILGLMCMLQLVVRGSNSLEDSDTLWHISTGKLILSTMSFPHVDTWSHTFSGQPWMARDWLSQVVLYLGYASGGWQGLAFVTATAASLAVVVIGYAWGKHTNPLVMLCMGFIALRTMQATMLARPHIIALPVMALWTAWLLHAASTTRRPPWLALGVMVLWSSLHAGFTIGFIIAGAIALDAIWNTEPAERMRAIASWLLFGCGCIMACMVNPYGHLPLMINIQMFSGNEAMAFVEEWEVMRMANHNIAIVAYATLLIASLFEEARKNIFRILLGLFILYTSIRHERFVMLLAIIPPLLAQETAPRQLRKLLDSFNLFRKPDPLLARAYWKPLLVVLPALIAVAMVVRPANLAGYDDKEKALAAVPAEIRKSKVFNSYNLGGYLVSRDVPTFIDGRTDQLFLNGFVTEFMKRTKGEDAASFEQFMEKHSAKWAFILVGSAEAKHFEKLGGWKKIYGDKQTLVFVRTDA